ncbi:S9 family peptidase [Luteipulveratus mongoliensis]|uniref:Peptidase S9 prolyl oligopeptidase catalytic domain-containing protein n=1 Tax=Luteipulveratus mongoliensis TaxID=571913 RepID=A0A0K1JFN4_9MICO|nr:alpha/beta fold hydrolase [Luteipulveratus mongoliensis]AKU15519.1 hypothetical protein VV02_06020 [Luteipulveratus mongoliensis]
MPNDNDRLIQTLLNLRTWSLFDVDDAGHVLAGHDELGTIQLIEIAPDGTRTPLTRMPTRVSGKYVPGRRAVVVQHDAGGNELHQLGLLDLTAAALPAGPDALTPLVDDPEHMNVLREVTADTLVYSSNRRNGVDMDVYARDLASGEERAVYEEGGFVANVALSHDGAHQAVTCYSLQPASTSVSIDGEPLTAPDEQAEHGGVAWSADDATVIMSSNHDRDMAAIARVSLDGSQWNWLVEDDEHELGCWVSPDGLAMVVGRHVDGVFELAVHEADGTLRCPIRTPVAGVPEVVWAPDGSRVAMSISAATDPGSIHLVDARTGESTVVVDALEGVDVAAREQLVTPTGGRVPTPDGEQVPCFVYAGSSDADPQLQGASVLLIHGGPEAAAYRNFMPVPHVLAAAGFTVLVPNVRGSAAYGKRWVSLDDVERRLDSVADLAAIREWLPSQGLDPERAALWGGSYGGYMVLAGVSTQPDLWAAGVDIVGMSSLVTFLENTSDYRRALREREYGSLEHDRAVLEKASPLTYLDQIRAPLFVIHGANDPRVPLSEAEQIKAALDQKGVECELRVYADEGHGLAKRANRLDAYPAAVAFLVRHLTRA